MFNRLLRLLCLCNGGESGMMKQSDGCVLVAGIHLSRT